MSKANYSLRLQPSLKAAAEGLLWVRGRASTSLSMLRLRKSSRRWRLRDFLRSAPERRNGRILLGSSMALGMSCLLMGTVWLSRAACTFLA